MKAEYFKNNHYFTDNIPDLIYEQAVLVSPKSFLEAVCFDYNRNTMSATISLTDEIYSGRVYASPIDNCNIGYYRGQDTFTFTSETIAHTEAFNSKALSQDYSNMTGRVDLICPEIYSPTSGNLFQPINITAKNTITNKTKNFTIQIENNPNPNFPYAFTSSTGSVMYIEKRAFGPQKPNAKGKWGDLNLLVLMFIFGTIGLKLRLCSKEDHHIKNSFATAVWN